MTQTGSPYRDDNERRAEQDSPRREKFIERRLAVQFGINHAEAWIKYEKSADKPDWAGWLTIFMHRKPELPEEKKLLYLRQFGRPISERGLDQYGPLLESLDPEKVEIYAGALDHPVFLVQRRLRRVFTAARDEGKCFMTEHYAMIAFMNATIIRAWKDGDSELAAKARDLLCTPYVEAIKEAAQKYQREYDEATIFTPGQPRYEFHGVARFAPYEQRPEFRNSVRKFARIIAWGKTGNKLRAVLISGDKLHPDDFIDTALAEVNHGEYTLDEILRDSVRKRRILETVIRDLPLDMCEVLTKVEYALFVSFDCIKIPLPPGKELL